MTAIHIKTFLSPYADSRTGVDTAYYREGIRRHINRTGGAFEEISLAKHPQTLRVLRRLRDSYRLGKIGKLRPVIVGAVDTLARLIGRPVAAGSGVSLDSVGRFIFKTDDGSEWRIYIDSHDAGDIHSPDALEWSDLYFKTSYLSGRDYPSKVAPLCQCSFQLLSKLDLFRSLRTMPKKYDLCFTTRVWGGRNDVEGIEHNLRLLEALSRVECRKYLRAYLIAGDRDVYAQRLEKQGIPWSFDPLPLSEHVDVLGSSRLNVHRLGMHNSITWRMSELLCMGACPVLDQTPHTVWPEPIRDGANYLTLDAGPSAGRWVASDKQYDAIPERIEKMLKDVEIIERIARTNRLYFDQYLDPEAVGCEICRRVTGLASKG